MGYGGYGKGKKSDSTWTGGGKGDGALRGQLSRLVSNMEWTQWQDEQKRITDENNKWLALEKEKEERQAKLITAQGEKFGKLLEEVKLARTAPVEEATKEKETKEVMELRKQLEQEKAFRSELLGAPQIAGSRSASPGPMGMMGSPRGAHEFHDPRMQQQYMMQMQQQYLPPPPSHQWTMAEDVAMGYGMPYEQPSPALPFGGAGSPALSFGGGSRVPALSFSGTAPGPMLGFGGAARAGIQEPLAGSALDFGGHVAHAGMSGCGSARVLTPQKGVAGIMAAQKNRILESEAALSAAQQQNARLQAKYEADIAKAKEEAAAEAAGVLHQNYLYRGGQKFVPVDSDYEGDEEDETMAVDQGVEQPTPRGAATAPSIFKTLGLSTKGGKGAASPGTGVGAGASGNKRVRLCSKRLPLTHMQSPEVRAMNEAGFLKPVLISAADEEITVFGQRAAEKLAELVPEMGLSANDVATLGNMSIKRASESVAMCTHPMKWGAAHSRVTGNRTPAGWGRKRMSKEMVHHLCKVHVEPCQAASSAGASSSWLGGV